MTIPVLLIPSENTTLDNLFFDRARAQKVKSKGSISPFRAWPPRRSSCAVQTVGHLVEFGEARRHPAEIPPLERWRRSSIVGWSNSSSGRKSSAVRRSR